MEPVYVTLANIVWWPLLASTTAVVLFARRDSYWLLPGMYSVLLLAVDTLLMDRPWAILPAVGLFMFLFREAILRWDKDLPDRKGPITAFVPRWARDRPHSLADMEALDRSKPKVEDRTKTKGYHRPEAVKSRTGELKQLGS